MQVRSPYLLKRNIPPADTKQAVIDLHQVGEVLKELDTFKNQMAAEHKAKMDTLDSKIAEAQGQLERAKTIQKGDKGNQGDTPSIPEIIKAAIPYLPKGDKGDQGDAGETPMVDHKKIANLVLGSIVVPETPTIDIPAITDAVVKHIVDKKKLKTDHIDGFEQTMAPIRSLAAGFRGGGDVVAAGTGVTITTTNGVKTINASGGAGFTQLTATETPNGSLKIFTFAAAAAQPSLILSDNVLMKATSSAGTVNWTWNAGLKQATMTIPPVDDIAGIV